MAQKKKKSKPTVHTPKPAQSAPASTPSPPRVRSLVPPTLPPLANGEARKVLFLGHASAHPQRLHSYFKQDGWAVTSMDSEPSLNPDIKGTLTELSTLSSGAYDAIWAQHLLQQFYMHQIGNGLREMFRIIKDGGFVFLSIPDAQLAASFLANNKYDTAIYTSPAGPINAMDILFGYHKFLTSGATHQGHKFAFTAESIGLAMRACGFTNVQVQSQYAEIIVVGYKYPYDHPERAERVSITRGAQYGDIPTVTDATAAQPKEGSPTAPQPLRPGMLVDELDTPPRMWKPLNLRK